MSPIGLNWQIGLDAIGWLIVHSAWQFLVLGLLAWLIGDVLLGSRSASARYFIFGAALATTIVCPLGTWFLLLDAVPVTEVPASTMTYQESVARNDAGATPNPPPITPRTTATQDRPMSQEVAMTPVAAPPQEGASTQDWLESAVVGIRPWLPTITMFWCAGVSLLALRLGIGWWRVERLKRSGRTVQDPALLSLLNTAISKLNVRRSVRLLVSDLIESPVVVGAIRSVILVPASFISNVSPDHIEAIMAHELAHIRRYDYLVNLLQTAIETLFFYHPAVWWLSHRMRVERENCCDDLAAAAMASPVVYSRALMALEEMRDASLAPALGAKDGVLVTRIRRLLGLPVRRNSPFASGTIVAAIGVTLGLVLLAGFSSLQAQDAEATPPEDESRFVAMVKEGMSVELLAIMPHQGERADAWLPDGRKPEKTLKLTRVPSNSRIRKVDGVVLFLKYQGISPEVWPTYQMDGLKTMGRVDENGIAAIIADPDEIALTSSITIGIPDQEFGPWRKFDTHGELIEPVRLESRYQEIYDLVQLHDIQDQGPRVMIRWTSDHRQLQGSYRKEVIAVDKTGERHRISFKTLWGRPTEVVRNVDGFNLTLSEIDHFEYRLCPIRHWVTFHDLALTPEVKTNPTIEQRDVPIAKPNDSQATYRGRIVLPDGSPTQDEGWLYQTATTPNSSYLRTIGQYQNQFEFQSNHGTTYFSFFPEEHAPVWTDKMEVGPGDIIEGIQLVLRPGIDVSVKVRNDAGQPVPKAVVVAHPIIHGSPNGPVHKFPVNESGEVTLKHMAEAEYDFRVEAPGYEVLRSEPISVSTDKPVSLVLRKAAPTTGIVYDTEGKPAAGAKLIAAAELYDGGTNFVSDPVRYSFIGETWATTDAEGHFSLTELSQDRRYLFVIEGPDESRLLHRDFQAGQKDVVIRLPRRHDLHIALRGELDEYVKPGFENRMNISQQFSIQTDVAGARDRIGASVLIRPNATGGSVTYKGLVVDPEADWSNQNVEVSFGTKKQFEQVLKLSDQPVCSYSLNLGPIPDVPIRFPSATTHRLNSGRIGNQAVLFHSEGHSHWMLYHKGFLQTGLEHSRWFDLKVTHLAWRFRGKINAFFGERKIVDGNNQWEHERSYPVNFEYAPPDLTLKFDGQEINFKQGRVIFLDEETGDPIQLDLPLPDSEQLKDKAFMAKFEEQVDAALAARAKAEPSPD